LHWRMTSQLVALATQARKAWGLEALDERDELDDELPEPHMSMSARRQLPLPFELVREVEFAKQVPHLAMMLSTAFTHIDEVEEDEMEDGQPVRKKRDNITPAKARLMRHPREKLLTNYILAWPKRSTTGDSNAHLPIVAWPDCAARRTIRACRRSRNAGNCWRSR